MVIWAKSKIIADYWLKDFFLSKEGELKVFIGLRINIFYLVIGQYMALSALKSSIVDNVWMFGHWADLLYNPRRGGICWFGGCIGH